jgi:hypothetical protein
MRALGSLGNLGGLAVSSYATRWGNRVTNSRPSLGVFPEGWERNEGHEDGTAKRRQRSAAGRAARSRSTS